MERKDTILVPWDFSQVAEYALHHAIQFSQVINANVVLLHVVKKAKEEEEANPKLQEISESTFKKYGVRPGFLVKEGSIFNVITEVGNEMDAALIIMGTHGIKGMQKFTGSWALKVIVGCVPPVLVVQEEPAQNVISNIIFPIDFRQENKQKLVWANYLFRLFRSKIHVVMPKYTDPLILKKTNQNFIFAKNYFDDNNIDYTINTLEGKKAFAEETVDFSKTVDNSLILIMTTKNISFQDYVLGADEQKIIGNTERLPVMCINPRTDLGRIGGFN